MSLDRNEHGEQLQIFPGSRLWQEFRKEIEEVTRYLSLPAKGIVSLKLSYRGDKDWLAIMKRYNDQDKIEVLFGSGSSFVGALLGLEVSIEHDKWRLDRWANEK